MNIQNEIKKSKNFEKRYLELLHISELKSQNVFRQTKLYYLKILIQMLREYDGEFVFSEILIKIKRYLRYSNKRKAIGILVDTLDKGGVEQVVYNLTHGFKDFNPYILITGSKYGEVGWKLRKEGFYVYLLKGKYERFHEISKKINLQIINSHYSVWNLNKIKNDGMKITYTIHSGYTWVNNEQKDLREREYANVDCFIAVSSSAKEYFCKKFSIETGRVRVIENGFDLKRWENYLVKREKRDLRKSFVFLNVASFTPLKNQTHLLVAFKDVLLEIPQSELWLIGNVVSEEYYQKVLELIKFYNLGNSVKIFDLMDQSELFKIYKTADCFVLSSLQEGAPNVLLESMYMQLPIISTNVGNVEELLSDFGMIIPNCYEDLSKLTYADLEAIALNFNPTNKENLVLGMLSVFSNYQYWVDKAKESSSFLKDEYIMDKVVEKYEKLFLENLV